MNETVSKTEQLTNVQNETGEDPLLSAHSTSDSAQPASVRNRASAEPVESPPWRVATVLAFVLAILCSAALGYALYRFFNVLSLSSRSIHELVFLTRAGIMAVATTLAITFVMLGFATFMIAARGEFRVEGAYSKSKGMLQSGAPGLFFVLCGTVVLCVLLNQKFSFDGTDEVLAATRAAREGETITSKLPGGGGGARLVASGRSIASGGDAVAYEEVGFFSQDVSAFNAFAMLVTEGGASDDSIAAFVGSWVKPIRVTGVRFNWYRSNHNIPEDSMTAESLEGDKKFNLRSGYLIVPEDGRLLNEKLAELRASVGKGNSVVRPLVQGLLPLLETAYVFKGAKPMDGFPAKTR